MTDPKSLRRLLEKTYRDGYLDTLVKGGIAYQMRALREKTGLTQEKFGKAIGKPQTVVSRLEDTEYGSVSVQTLLDVATALNVALLVKFVSYPHLLEETKDVSPGVLAVDNVFESVEKAEDEAGILNNVAAPTIARRRARNRLRPVLNTGSFRQVYANWTGVRADIPPGKTFSGPQAANA